MMDEIDYPNGTQYERKGKVKSLCTVVDKHVTTNREGKVVKVRYVSTHEFMGQTVTEYDVVSTTIKMGLLTSR